jgi:hypothetical protein
MNGEKIVLRMKPLVSVEDGKHFGQIVNVARRTEPYDYTDVFIRLTDAGLEKVELKWGAPSHLTSNSKLGKMLALFKKIELDEEVDLREVLVGHNVVFQTLTEVTPKGEFARIVDGSIKPFDGGLGKSLPDFPNFSNKPEEK